MEQVRKLLEKDQERMRTIQNLQAELANKGSDYEDLNKRLAEVLKLNKELEKQVQQSQTGFNIMKEQYNDQIAFNTKLKQKINQIKQDLISNPMNLDMQQLNWAIGVVSAVTKPFDSITGK